MPIARSYLSSSANQNDLSLGRKEGTKWKNHTENTPGLASCRPELEVAQSSSVNQNTEDGEKRLGLGGRDELIQRIKRDQRPQWLQNDPEHDMHRAAEPLNLRENQEIPGREKDFLDTDSVLTNQHSIFERPRSALHAGDFHQDRTIGQGLLVAPGSPRPLQQQHRLSQEWGIPPSASSWRAQPQHLNAYANHVDSTESGLAIEARTRASSYSTLSSSFIFRPPTSPLAVQSNSNDLDLLEENSRHRSRSPDKSSRRRTYSPQSLQRLSQSVSTQEPSHTSHMPLPMRRESTYPYQAHQPRRSLSSVLGMTPNSSGYESPIARSRRPSMSSDASPIQHAPLVGRYEESILRGRMSTTPSKPLDFVAQIGVLGKGNCKPSLRCPSHISIPFPAVFYNYSAIRGKSNSVLDGPSPYVGLVDLENFQKPLHQKSPPTDSSIGALQTQLDGFQGEAISPLSNKINPIDNKAICKPRIKARRLSKKPPGTSYRIPQQGQLQVIIKNPHKTAVKLFLVPYDLAGMKPGQKTFIRQRSYSAGPIIDMPLSLRNNLGTDRPEAALSHAEDPRDRPILRYLIHLHICCCSEGRFYLYKGIRIVFANRVPDGKEKLRHEIQLPEPRYSSYKPELEPRSHRADLSALTRSIHPHRVYSTPNPPVEPAIASCFVRAKSDNVLSNDADMYQFDTVIRPTVREDEEHIGSQTSPLYEKLDRGTYSSSSNSSRPQSPRQGEGLISQQFRGWAEQIRK